MSHSHPPVVGFDGLSITSRPAGVGVLARGLLRALLAAPDGPRVAAVLPRGSAAAADLEGNVRGRVLAASVDGPDTPRALWFQHARMPGLLRGAGVAAHLGPAFVLPAFRWDVPSAVIVHDAAWRRFPESKSLRFRLYMDRIVPASALRARAVICPSAFARSEALDLVPGLDPAKVRVVAPGVTAPPPPADPGAALARLGVPRPFVLSVSNLDSRKNLPALAEAWRALRRRGLPHALVLAGGDAERVADLRAALAPGEGEPLLLTGWLAPGDLGALYAAADLVAVPSLYEGFGLPVIEAMAAGVPVACADAASLPEVAGGAAVLFDPADRDAIARGLEAALAPGPGREARVRLGRARAASFSWDAAGAAVAGILREIAG